MAEFEYEVVALELEDGTEAEFAILESFEADGAKYVLLGEVKGDVLTDDEDSLIFLKDETDETCAEGEIILTMIDSDDEYDHVVDVYLEMSEQK